MKKRQIHKQIQSETDEYKDADKIIYVNKEMNRNRDKQAQKLIKNTINERKQ